MAEINPNLLLQIRPQADVGRTFGSILTNVANFDRIRENREQAPLRNQLLQQRVDSGQLINQQQAGINREQANQALTQFAARIKPMLDAGDTEGVRQLVQQQKAGPLGGAADNFLSILDTNPALAKQRVDQVVELGRQSGQFGQAKSVGQREFDELIKIAQDPNSTQLEKDSARRKLGDLARVGTSAQERIASNRELTSDVARSEAEITTAKEEAKLGAQASFKPQIVKAVKQAEAEAKSRGETLSALNRSKAALPGLNEAVSQLRELAPIATSTFGGKAFDFAVKESGFGSTKGATARAKFIAIVNNQVLPLLKETFGAAFTFQEGEALKATMGDPDASPEEKLAQLDAFIAQKQRDIATKEAELSPNQPDFSGFKIISVE
jgi:hypothetical protein